MKLYTIDILLINNTEKCAQLLQIQPNDENQTHPIIQKTHENFQQILSATPNK